MDQCWKRFSEWGKGCHCDRVFSITVTNQTEKKTRQAGISIAGSFQILQGQTQWQKFPFLLPLFCMSSSRLVGGRQELRRQKIRFLLSSSESSTFYVVKGERQVSAVCQRERDVLGPRRGF